MPALLGARPLIDYTLLASNADRISAFMTLLPKFNNRGLLVGSGMIDEQNPAAAAQLWIESQAMYEAAGGTGMGGNGGASARTGWGNASGGGGTVTPTPTPTPTALNTVTMSDIIESGTPSTGYFNNATDGSTLTSNNSGLTINSAARTYSWDGTGPTGINAAGISEALAGFTTKTSPVYTLAARTGNLKLSGRLFFRDDPMMTGILAGYAATSVLSAAIDDGTLMRVTTDGQGYPVVAPANSPYALTTNGIKLVTLTETPSSGSPTVSTIPILVVDKPTPKTLPQAKPILQRLLSEKSSASPLIVGPNPPTIVINTSASLANGRALGAAPAIPIANVPQGKSGVAGYTNLSAGYIYADTTLGTAAKGFAPGPSLEFLATSATGNIFDARINYNGTAPNGTIQVQTAYTENYDPANPSAATWYLATAEPSDYASAVAFYTASFANPPAGANKRAIRFIFGQGISSTGMNVESGVTIGAFDDGRLRGAFWNDSFQFNQANNYTINTSAHTCMREFNSFHAINYGHRTNAYGRLGGTTGVHARVADRMGSNPWGINEATQFGLLNYGEFHMSINDYLTTSYNTVPASPKFNNAGGSNAIILGEATLSGWLILCFRRYRFFQANSMVLVDAGFAAPDQLPTSAYLTILRNAFDAVFLNDPLAVFYDYTTETYRYMGVNRGTGYAQAITAGAQGSSLLFPYNLANITATRVGDILDVTAVDTRLDVGMFISTGATTGNSIKKQISGTPGGIGQYQLLLAQSGDVTVPTSMQYYGDSGPAGGPAAHPTSAGGILRGKRNAGVTALAAAIGAA